MTDKTIRLSDDDLIQAADRLSRYDWQDWTEQDIEDAESIVRAFRRLAALPAAPGVRVKPTDEQVASACLSYRHDFGLLPEDERKTVMFQAREWLHAWQKELAALDAPAPDALEALETVLRADANGMFTIAPETYVDLKRALARYRGGV